MAIFKIKYYHLKSGSWVNEIISLKAENVHDAKQEVRIVLKGNIFKRIEQINSDESYLDGINQFKNYV